MVPGVASLVALALLLSLTRYAVVQRRLGLDQAMRAGLVVNLLGVAVVWLRADKPLEGPTLLVLSSQHGVTLADLLIALPLREVRRLVEGYRVSARENRR